MKKGLYKLLAFVLCVCMIVGLVPAVTPTEVKAAETVDSDTLELWLAEGGKGTGTSAESPFGEFVKSQSDGASTSVFGKIKAERTKKSAVVHVSGEIAVYDNFDFELMTSTTITSLTIVGEDGGAKLYIADTFNNGNSALFKMNQAGKIKSLTLKNITLENTSTARDKYCFANWGNETNEVFPRLTLENVTFNGRASGCATINYFGGLTMKDVTFNGGTYNLNLSSAYNSNLTTVESLKVEGNVTICGFITSTAENSAITVTDGAELHLGNSSNTLTLQGGKFDMTATVDNTVTLKKDTTISGTYTAGSGLGTSKAMFSVAEDGVKLSGKVVMDSATKNLQIASGKKVDIEGLSAGSSVGVTYTGTIGNGGSAQVFTGTGATQDNLQYVKSDNSSYIMVFCNGSDKDTLKDGGDVTLSHAHANGYWLATAKKVSLTGSNFTITGSQNCETHADNTVSYLPVSGKAVNSVTLTPAVGQMFDPAKVEEFNTANADKDIKMVKNEDGTLTVTFGPAYSGTTVSLAGIITRAEAKIGNTEYATLSAALEAAQDGDTVELMGTSFTAASDLEVKNGVTIKDTQGNTFTATATEGEEGNQTKVSMDAKGNVVMTGGAKAHLVPDGSATLGGSTYTGKGETGADLELSDDGTVSLTGGTVEVSTNGSLTVNGTSITASKLFATVTYGEPKAGQATVVIPDGGEVTSGDTKYPGAVTLTIDENGNIIEHGSDVGDLELQRDEKGLIASNGKSNQSERLQPEFKNAEPNATYYYNINGGTDWYSAVADENGILKLNSDLKYILVYGDYVNISGRGSHTDAVKFRLLSNKLLEGTFENASSWTPRTGIYGWRTTAPGGNNQVETGSMGTYVSSSNSSGASMAGKVAELNANEAASLYQEIDVSGQREFTWSLDFAGRKNGVSGSQIMAMVIGPVKDDGNYDKVNGQDMFQKMVSTLPSSARPTSSNMQTGPFELTYDDNGVTKTYTVYMFWGYVSRAYHFSGTVDVTGQSEMVFAFTAVLPSSGGAGNILDNVVFKQPAPVYMVDGYYYETLEGAIKAAAAAADKTIEINDASQMPTASQSGTLPAGVKFVDKNGNVFEAKTDAEVSVEKNTGKVTVKSGTVEITPSTGSETGEAGAVSFGAQGALKAHDVTVGSSSTVTVTVTTDEAGAVTGATVSGVTPNEDVIIDGVTFNGNNTSYDLDDPFAEAAKGTKATLSQGSSLTVNTKKVEATTGTVIVEKGNPTDTDARVIVPSGSKVKIGSTTYTGPIVLAIHEDGTVEEIGLDVTGLQIQTPEDGKYPSNGQSGTAERLEPVITGAEPGATYYWRINGEGNTSGNIRYTGGGTWYTATADESGNLTLNEGGKYVLVYGDYVEISGTRTHPNTENFAKFKFLSKELLNGGFEEQNAKASASSSYPVPRVDIYGWRTTASNTRWGYSNNQYCIETGAARIYGLAATNGMTGNMAELNAYEAASLYQEIDTSGEKRFAWSLDYAGRPMNNLTQVMAVVIGPTIDDSADYQKTSSSGKDMFQQLVEKLMAREDYEEPTASTPGKMTGPYTVDGYTIWILFGQYNVSNHFNGVISTTGEDGNRINEMVFAFTAIKPTSGGIGNLLDNVMFAKPDPAYMVDGEPFATLEDAIEAATDPDCKDPSIEINQPSKLSGTDSATLPEGVTLVDPLGTKFTGDGVEVSVDSTGKVTVTEGTAHVVPGTPDEEGNQPVIGVQGKSAHDVLTGGEADVTVTKDEDGAVTSATVTPAAPTDEVTVDGITYTAPEGTNPEYDVDDPFNGEKTPAGTQAVIPADKAEEEGFEGLHVNGGETGDGFTVKPADDGGDVTVTKGAGDYTTKTGTVNATVQSDSGKATVNGTTYTAPEGAEDGLTLGLVTTEDGEDVVELLGGSLDMPEGQDVYVNSADVKNTGSGDLTVTKDKPVKGQATVDIPEGGKVTINGTDYDGEASVVIDENGNVSFAGGTVTLKPAIDNNNVAGKTDVAFPDGKSVHVENASEETGMDIKVTVPAAEGSDNGKAEVPAGGKVEIGGKTYTATEETVFEFDSEGNVTVVSGGVELDDGKSVGFGNATLGNGGDATNSGITVEVTTPADGEGGGKAKVTVPNGETFTVTDKEGNTHTYTNNGTEALELEVDEDGNVTVKDLPSGGLELGPDAPITVTDPNGGNPNSFTAGANGATLKDNSENNSNPPLLSEGSVILPNEGSSLRVQDPTNENKEKKLEGRNVEITAADGSTDAKVKATGKDELKSEVKVESTRYSIPKDETAEMKSGTLGAPAKGIIEENKDGPGNHDYVLVPDEANKGEDKNLFTDEADTSEEQDKSNVFAEPGAAFDIQKKVNTGSESTDKEHLNPSIGHYEGAGEGANVTVNHDDGSVTLNEGSLNVSGTGTSDRKPSVKVGGHDITTDGNETITVTKPGEDGTGADVVVPAGGSVTIDGHTYENTGDDELTLHMDDEGNVSVKKGTVELDEGGKVGFGETTITDSGETGNGVTVTVPAAEGSENAKVVVPENGSVTVGDPTGTKYENAGSGNLELEVDSKGNVTLDSGKTTSPVGGNITVDGNTVHSNGNDVTVEKETSKNPKVTVPESGTVTVKDKNGESNNYKNASKTEGLVIELTDDGPALSEGAVELGQGGSIGVNGATVENTGEKVTVEAGKSSAGKATVTVPEDGSVNVNGVEVEGPAEIVIDDDGTAHVTPGGDKQDVKVDGKTYHKNEGAEEGTVDITPEGTVTTKPADSYTMELEIPTPADKPLHIAPGEVVTFEDKNGKTTTLTGGEDDSYVKVDENGNITLTDSTGAADYGTYNNAGDGELKLTVDGETAELTGGTVHVGPDDKIKVNDDTLTAGKNGATLTYGDENDTLPHLDSGSVILPEDGAKIVAKDPTATGTDKEKDKSFDGKNVEVAVDENVITVTDPADGVEGEVTVQDGTTYTFPEDGQSADMQNGTLKAPAKGEIKDNKDGPGSHPFVLVPDKNNGDNKLWTSDAADGPQSNVFAEPGAAFDIREKTDKNSSNKEESNLNSGSFGHYKGEGEGANLVVDHEKGTVTLTDGSVTMTKGSGTDDKTPSITVDGITNGEITGDDVTVTTTGEGENKGADVTVPAGGSVEIGGKTYENGSDSEELTLHVDKDGNVSVVDGTVEVPDGKSVEFGDVTLGNGGDDAADDSKVTVEAGKPEGKATVTVPSGETLTVTDKNGSTRKYANEGEDDLVLEVDPKGNVTLESGKTTNPAGKDMAVDGNTVHSNGNDVTVEKETGKNPKVTVPEGGTVTVKDKHYGNNNFENHSDTEDLVIELTDDGPTLSEGAVDLNMNGSIDVNGVTVENTGDTGEKVTVEANEPSAGKATVTVPEGGKTTVNGVEVEGPAEIVIDEDGNASIKPEAGEKVVVDGKSYESNDGEGTINIAPPTENSVKGDVTLEPVDGFTVELTFPVNNPVHVGPGENLTFKDSTGRTTTVTGGENGGYIHVEEDGTVTLTDENGAADYGTYKNAGEGAAEELTLTVDGDKAELTGGTVHVDGGDKLTVNDDTFTAGSEGATLTYGEKPNDPPHLDSGSVVLPGGKDSTIVVTDPSADGADKDKKLAGQNVEVSAGGTVKATGTAGDGNEGEVTVQDGTRYLIPDGETADMKNGTFTAPAKGEILDNKDGPGSHPYVLVPDENNEDTEKLWTSDAADGPQSNVFAEPGAAFDIREKTDKNSSNKDESNLQPGSLGHYEAMGEAGANVTVDHEEGTVTLTDGSLNVSGEGKDGKNPSVIVDGHTVETDGDETINVTKPGASGDGADVTVPKGGKVTIDGTEYENTGDDNLTLHMDDEGNVSVVDGSIELGDGDGMGFGDVTLSNGGDNTGSGITVEATGDSASVTVPAGETLTVTDKDGKEHTYKNNGEGDLTLEVDKDGNVTVASDNDLPTGGLELGPDTTVDVGGNELTAGENGATLKPNANGDAPKLDEGSVKLPKDKNASVVVTDPTATGENKDKRLEGKNVEVSADEHTVKAAAESGVNGEVKVEGSTNYLIPAGKEVEMKNGSFGAPAKGLIEDNKDGPGTTNPYVLQPDKENNGDNKLWTSDAADNETDSNVFAEPGAAFDIREKKDHDSSEKGESNLQPGSLGRYEATGETGADVTVNHGTGDVTLNDGSLNVSGEGKDGKNPSVKVDNHKIETNSDETITVTKPGYDGHGADVTVPAGGSVTIDGTKYENTGDGELTLHLDDKGNVSVLEGTVEVPDGESVGFGSATLGNGGENTNSSITVDVVTPADGEGNGKAEVTVPAGETLTVTDKDGEEHTYKNAIPSADLTVTVDENGNVTLEDGAVTLPEGETGSVNVTVPDEDGTEKNHEVSGEGITVNKNDGRNPSVKTSEGGSVTVDDGETKTEYKAPEGKSAEVELTPDGPVLTDGAVELPKDGSIGVNGATVENTGDTADKKVTVETNTPETGKTTVEIPEGGKAEVNGVEVKGPADIVIDEEGVAHIKPKEAGDEFIVDGKTYKANDTEGTIDIAPPTGEQTKGTVSLPDPSSFTVELTFPVNNPVHLGPGESVTFKDTTGKTTTLTGGENGGYVNVDEDGTVTLTDETGTQNNGTFKNAGSGELKLTVDEETGAKLTGGTVEVSPNTKLAVNDDTFTTGEDGATVTYGGTGNPHLDEGSVILPDGKDATIVVTDPTATTGDDKDKTFSGQNVEVKAGNPVQVTGKTGDGTDGEVTVQGGTRYIVPDGGTADLQNGSLKAPAKGEIKDNKDGPGNTNPYVLKPDKENNGNNKLWTSDAAGNNTDSNVFAEQGAGFDILKKKDGVTGNDSKNDENLDAGSYGHYVGAGSGADLTVNHGNGEVTLKDGSVTMTKGEGGTTDPSVTVDGITNGEITGDGVTVTASGEGENKGADVVVPAGGSVTIGDQTYENGSDSDDLTLHVDKDGNVTVTDGSVKLGDGQEVKFGDDITLGNSGTDAADESTITVEVMTPADANGNGEAEVTVPAGETLTVTDQDGKTRTYTNGGTDDTKVIVDQDGNITLESGSATLDDGDSVKFGDVTLGNGGDSTDTDITVNAQGGESAQVTVPAGETLTVTDQDGKTHTYKNNGDGPVTLTVDKNGNVSVNSDDALPANGLEVGPDSPIKVGENDLTTGDQGATLKPNANGEAPKLDKGSVVLPEDTDASVEADGTTFTGKNAEVFADAKDAGFPSGNTNPAVKGLTPGGGKVDTQNSGGTGSYFIPENQTAEFKDNKLQAPAVGSYEGNVGTSSGEYVVVPGEDNGDAKLYDSTTPGHANEQKSDIVVDDGAKFDVQAKGEGTVGEPTGETVGRYESTEDGTKVIVDHKTGEVELTEGTMKVGDGENDTSITVGGNEITSKSATVTAPGKDAEGNDQAGSADVEVNAGESVTVTDSKGNQREYTAETDSTFHVNPDGTVELTDGSVKLADDESVKFGDTTITGSGNEAAPNVTVTVPAADGSENAKVEVEANGTVTVDGDEYTAGTGKTELEVTPEGDVKLDSGSVTLPDNGSSKDTASVEVTAPGSGSGDDKDYQVSGDGVTVEKGAGNPQITVPENGSVSITEEDGSEHKYTNPDDTDMKVELTDNGPRLTEGKAEVGKDDNILVGDTEVKNAGDKPVIVDSSDSENNGNPSVTVPQGGSVDFENPDATVDAPDGDVKVKVNDDGILDVELAPGESVTVDGRTYTNPADGTTDGKVHIAPDGSVTTEGDSIEESVNLPARNLKVGKDETLTYKNSKGETVTLTGIGEDGGTVDLDGNGNVTVTDGNIQIKGNVSAKADEGCEARQVGDVTLKVTDENGKGVAGANVEVQIEVQNPDGTTTRLSEVTDANGNVTFEDVPYGTYWVDVKKSEGGTEYEATGSFTVDGPNVGENDSGFSFTLYGFSVNTKVESDLEDRPAVGNLDSVVTPQDKQNAQDAQKDVSIDVTLKANKLGEGSSQGMDQTKANEIEEKIKNFVDNNLGSNSEITDHIDVTIEKTITEDGVVGVPELQSSTNSLLKLTFQLSDAMKRLMTGDTTMENIFIIRQHGEAISKMRKVTPAAGKKANFECYYVEEYNGVVYITILAKNFSVYAFGVATNPVTPNDPSSGGSYDPAPNGVSIPQTPHGTVEVTPENPKPGDRVTVKPVPDNGYALTDPLTVTDRYGQSVEVQNNGDGTYSFVMPNVGVTVSASFHECASAKFKDIVLWSWYHKYTDYVLDNGLMFGMGDGIFNPEGYVTRGQMVMTLWNLADNPVVNFAIPFPDVKQNEWYTEAIRWAASLGVIVGYDDGTFQPDRVITRDEMVAMLYRYEQSKGGGFKGEVTYKLPYNDSEKVGEWCFDAVAWCTMNGILEGKDGNVFDPYGFARRNELAVVLTKYDQLSK